jgi:hypothetical protein
MSNELLKAGTPVRISYEGTIVEQGDWPKGSLRTVVKDQGGNTHYYYEKSCITAERICPDVKLGDLWSSGSYVYVAVTQNSIGSLILRRVAAESVCYNVETFFKLFPGATLIYSPSEQGITVE